MPEPLSEQTIAIVKATVPVLAEYGTATTAAMYARLFKDPKIRALFNHSNQGESGTQVNALANAILAYAKNIDNLSVLLPVVERISQKHIGYHILAEHYPFVATALLDAISEVLGSAATPEILAAWGEAYWFLANIMIEREATIRQEIETTTGGWNGWRKFLICSKVPESEVVTSFILKPLDGGRVIPHRPGQYLTFRFSLADGSDLKRNYSISSAPSDEYYRISVKREAKGNGGSLFLHDISAVGDTVEATPPAGDFYLDETSTKPVVLLSGGVGLTPMVSMLEAIADRHPDRETYFVHGAMNSSMHAMDRHVRDLADNHGKTTVRTFYSEPHWSDEAGRTHDHDGFISVDWLKVNTPFETADFYLCGPKPFLRALVRQLYSAGVSASRIHFELFGPTDELMAA